MTKLKVVGEAIVSNEAGVVRKIEKTWPDQDVMKLSVCRSWVTRTFNRLRVDLASNEQLRVVFRGHLEHPPYTYYGGGIRGTRKLEIREGDME